MPTLLLPREFWEELQIKNSRHLLSWHLLSYYLHSTVTTAIERWKVSLHFTIPFSIFTSEMHFFLAPARPQNHRSTYCERNRFRSKINVKAGHGKKWPLPLSARNSCGLKDVDKWFSICKVARKNAFLYLSVRRYIWFEWFFHHGIQIWSYRLDKRIYISPCFFGSIGWNKVMDLFHWIKSWWNRLTIFAIKSHLPSNPISTTMVATTQPNKKSRPTLPHHWLLPTHDSSDQINRIKNRFLVQVSDYSH